MKKLTLKLTLISLIACAAFLPQQAQAMNWKKVILYTGIGAGMFYSCYKNYQSLRLIEAIEKGDIELALSLIKEGSVDFDAQDENGKTALMQAIKHDVYSIAELLIKKCVNLNLQDKKLQTALMIAIKNNSCPETLIMSLIEQGADPNLKDQYGTTPLMHAIINRRGEKDLITVLIEKSDLNIQDNKGLTVLMKSIYYQPLNKEAIKMLIKEGSDLSLQDKLGQTALIYYQRNNFYGQFDPFMEIENLIQNLQQFPTNNQKAQTLFNEAIQKNNDSFAVPALKLLYKNKTYYINTTHTMALFEKYGKTKEFKNLLKECKFFKCSKEELEKLRTMNFPLDETEFETQENLLSDKISHLADMKILYKKSNWNTF